MELNEAVGELRTDIRQFNEESLTPIKERLLSLEERDSAPGNEIVTDLEKRLLDAEQKQEAMEESFRLAAVNNGLIQGAEKAAEPFKGTIFKDIDEARRWVNGESREMTLGTTIASNGKLEPEEANAFIDHVIDETHTLMRIQTRKMRNQKANLDRFVQGTRKLVAAPGETSSVVDAATITTAKRQLVTSEVVWAENLSMSFIEDNIEQAGVEGHIVGMIAKAFGNDLNDLAWNGDETTGAFLVIQDGFNQLIDDDADTDVNVIADISSFTTTKAVLNKTLATMPNKFKLASDNAFFCTPAFSQNYADMTAERESGLGDATLVGTLGGLRYFGIPLIADPAVGATTTDRIVLTQASNLVFGIQRDVTYDSEWKPRERRFELTWTARIDYQYVFGGSIVLGDQVLAGLNV